MIQISNKQAEDAVRFLLDCAASIHPGTPKEQNRRRLMKKLAKAIQKRLDGVIRR